MKPLRRRDMELPTGAGADPGALAGVWVNTNDAGQGPARVEITCADGTFTAVTRGRDGAATVWGEEPCLYGGITTAVPLAWTVRHRFDGYDGLLQGNLNLGLLVLGTYKSYTDGRPGYFSREFYLKTSDDAPAPSGRSGGGDKGGELFAGVSEPERVELEPMLGNWINTDADTHGITVIEIRAVAGSAVARVHGRAGKDAGNDGDVDWGETDLGVFASLDEAGGSTLSLLAVYDDGPLTSQLQLRVPGGTLALANFNTFRDDRLDYFTREFYYRSR